MKTARAESGIPCVSSSSLSTMPNFRANSLPLSSIIGYGNFSSSLQPVDMVKNMV